jgi:hypothetical protein
MWSKTFWRDAIERAIKTIAQTAAAALIAAGTGLLDTHWITILSVADMAGIISLLTSIGSGLTAGTASLAGINPPGYAASITEEN